jgi:hypothetical protein
MTGAPLTGQALVASGEDESSLVFTLSGFDPSRKSEVFQIQLDMQRRASALDGGTDAAKALQWLNQYGRQVIAGSDYGADYMGSAEAKPYLRLARESFAKAMHDYATTLALADIESAYASAIEARSDATGTGAAEGESAVPKADAQTQSPNLSQGDTP